MLDWLKQHWFIFSALVVGGVAWGQTTAKMTELERKVAESASKEQRVEKIAEAQGRLDERTVMMLQEQREQRAILLEILNGQRAIMTQRLAVIRPDPAAASQQQTPSRPAPR